MKWTDLLVAVLLTAMVLSPLLRWCGLLSRTETVLILTVACTLSAVYVFLKGETGLAAVLGAFAITALLMLRRRRASPPTKPRS